MLIYIVLQMTSPKVNSSKAADPKDKKGGDAGTKGKGVKKVEPVKQSRNMLEFETLLLIFATLAMGFRGVNQLKIFSATRSMLQMVV